MGEDTTIITRADVYTQEIPSTSDSVMMSTGESSPPVQASISSTSFDILDDAKLGKVTPTTSAKTLKPTKPDAEAIEEAVPIVHTTLPVPQPTPKIERNGLDAVDMADTTKPLNEPEDDSCLIDCIYYTQKCCECTIL